jgi:hypothetical protein
MVVPQDSLYGLAKNPSMLIVFRRSQRCSGRPALRPQDRSDAVRTSVGGLPGYNTRQKRRGYPVPVPELALQLAAAIDSGNHDRAALIRAAMAH